MRLPADATLIVIDVQDAIDDPRWAPRNNPEAERNIAALIGAWRAEGLPLIHVVQSSIEPHSPRAPLAGETVIAKYAGSAFVGTSLEGVLDELGATTLVLCGALIFDAVEATARDAGSLGYQVFVVADACWAADAEGAHARLDGECARIVDAATTLRAAAAAKARQRHAAGKAG